MDKLQFVYTSDCVPVVHARWGMLGTAYGCTNCGFGVIAPAYNYCPDCGAKMDAEYEGQRVPQAVCVVRCRDCKYWRREVTATEHWVCAHHSFNERKMYTTPDFYCADGERRDSE